MGEASVGVGVSRGMGGPTELEARRGGRSVPAWRPPSPLQPGAEAAPARWRRTAREWRAANVWPGKGRLPARWRRAARQGPAGGTMSRFL
jgi:hypothetical protein